MKAGGKLPPPWMSVNKTQTHNYGGKGHLPQCSAGMGKAARDTHDREERGRQRQSKDNQSSSPTFGHEIGRDDGACNTESDTDFNHHANLGCRHAGLHEKVWPVGHECGPNHLRQGIANEDDPSSSPVRSPEAFQETGLFGCCASGFFFFVDSDYLLQQRGDLGRLVAQSFERCIGLVEMVFHDEVVG